MYEAVLETERVPGEVNDAINESERITMEPNRCYLITLCNGEYLRRVALKTTLLIDYFMLPKGKAELTEQLPERFKNFGKIVQVEEIAEIEVKSEAV